MTPERLDHFHTLYMAYLDALVEVTDEFERLYGFYPCERVGRWIVDDWNELYERRPEVIAMMAADAAMEVSERLELAEMTGAGPDTSLDELMSLLMQRR